MFSYETLFSEIKKYIQSYDDYTFEFVPIHKWINVSDNFALSKAGSSYTIRLDEQSLAEANVYSSNDLNIEIEFCLDMKNERYLKAISHAEQAVYNLQFKDYTNAGVGRIELFYKANIVEQFYLINFDNINFWK